MIRLLGRLDIPTIREPSKTKTKIIYPGRRQKLAVLSSSLHSLGSNYWNFIVCHLSRSHFLLALSHELASTRDWCLIGSSSPSNYTRSFIKWIYDRFWPKCHECWSRQPIAYGTTRPSNWKRTAAVAQCRTSELGWGTGKVQIFILAHLLLWFSVMIGLRHVLSYSTSLSIIHLHLLLVVAKLVLIFFPPVIWTVEVHFLLMVIADPSSLWELVFVNVSLLS